LIYVTLKNLYIKLKKRAARVYVSDSSMPLRHIGTIVIWEGNYNPDIKSIGYGVVFHEPYFEEFYTTNHTNQHEPREMRVKYIY